LKKAKNLNAKGASSSIRLTVNPSPEKSVEAISTRNTSTLQSLKLLSLEKTRGEATLPQTGVRNGVLRYQSLGGVGGAREEKLPVQSREGVGDGVGRGKKKRGAIGVLLPIRQGNVH